jgi:Acyl-CoA reductase (LuxC)
MGFIMAGNVPGAGLHEVSMALMAGAALIIKTASTEPVFFAGFLDTLGVTDGEVASRVALFNWERGRADLRKALVDNCDYLVAFGDDATLASLAGPRLFGFGSRLSGALVTREALHSPDIEALAGAIARDVTLFEQQGCLSPHHVFVEDPTKSLARRFSAQLAAGLERLAARFPPPARLAPDAAVQIRHARDAARWRRLGGEDIELWQGVGLGWTVIYEGPASFRVSPGYRTVYVTPINDLEEFEARLLPAAGHVEALAVTDPARRTEAIRDSLKRLGVSYLCAPGEMQSPPLEWRHGDGALLEMFQIEK